jgi:hypothetical protein
MSNSIQLLEVGQKATFKVYNYGTSEVVTRKIQSTYTHFNGDIQYNTKGENGGSGCDGYSFRNEDLVN